MGFFLVTFPWSAAPRVPRGWANRVHEMPRSSWTNLRLEASTDGSTRMRIVGTCAAGDQDHEAAAIQQAVGVDGTSVSTFEKSFLDGIAFLGGGTTSAREAFAAGSDVVAAMTRHLSHSLPEVVARRTAHHGSAAVILDPLTGAVRDIRRGASAFPWRRHLADIQWYVGLPSQPSRGQVGTAYDWIGHARTGRSARRRSAATSTTSNPVVPSGPTTTGTTRASARSNIDTTRPASFNRRSRSGSH